MRRYRILHTEASLGWGGQEIRIFREMEWMRRNGHTVALCAPENSEIYRRCRAAGIEAWPLERAPLKGPWTATRLTFRMLAWRPDIVNTHSSRDGWIGGIAARIAGAALIRSRHIDTGYPSQALWRHLGFCMLPHHLLTTSTRIRERLIEEVGVDPACVTNLPTGVDTSIYHPGVPATLHADLALPADKPIIGMISVLRSWKGHPDFIEAARRTRDALAAAGAPACHFVIAGGGPGTESIRGMVQDAGMASDITMLGHREDVPHILASLSAVVLPSTAHEGVPQILLQAQAMGRPVIGTSVGGIPDIVQDGETGLLVPPNNPGALSNAMLRILREPAFAASLAATALPRVLEKHSVDGMGHFLERLYADLVW
ncbi:hypothetical protein DB346_01075 [Verrucomicrobia bacterium LW23]|nr:hypothetical protein DB346_01075 [Verrucomicrobia bacterium LW23]